MPLGVRLIIKKFSTISPGKMGKEKTSVKNGITSAEIGKLTAKVKSVIKELEGFEKESVSVGEYTYTLYRRKGKLLFYRRGKGEKAVLKKLGRQDVMRLRATERGKAFLRKAKRLLLLEEALQNGVLNADRLMEKVVHYSKRLDEQALLVNRPRKAPVSGRLSLIRRRDKYGICDLVWAEKSTKRVLNRREVIKMRRFFYALSPATGKFFDGTNAKIHEIVNSRRKAKSALEKALKTLKKLQKEGII